MILFVFIPPLKDMGFPVKINIIMQINLFNYAPGGTFFNDRSTRIIISEQFIFLFGR